MEIKKGIINIIKSLKESIHRFPIPISLSTMLVFLLIYIQENSMNLSNIGLKNLERLSMTVGIGVILFASISLLNERSQKEKLKKLFLDILGIAIIALFLYRLYSLD